MRASDGKVYLIGAGPGAQDLMTLRGAKILAKADIVFYDALVDSQMLELCPNAKLVAVGKRCGKLSTAQKFIDKQLVDAAKKYQTILPKAAHHVEQALHFFEMARKYQEQSSRFIQGELMVARWVSAAYEAVHSANITVQHAAIAEEKRISFHHRKETGY